MTDDDTIQFVLVTHYQPPEGKPPIVHVWGPWPTRAKAAAARQRMRRADKDDPRADDVTYRVRKILDDQMPSHVAAGAPAIHEYLSTGCRHDDHLYCQSMTGQQGEKRPGRCKFCDAQCICPCHAPVS